MSDESNESSRSRRAFLRQTGATAVAAGVAGMLPPTLRAADEPASAELTPTGRKIRMGIVGGGFGLHFFWHLDPNSVVTAVSDHRPERRQKLTETYKCDKTYESLEELVKDPNVDAVAVFTGAPQHVEHSCLAMESGKHVVCAVPACMSLDEAQTLLDCKKKTGMRYMMAETSYYNQYTIGARDLFKENRFGDLFYSEVEYNHPITQADRDAMWIQNGKKTWRYGFPPMHYPTHATSYLVGVTRERLAQVSACGVLAPKIEGYGEGKNAYDNPFNGAVGLFRTDRGNICRVSLLWTGTHGGDRATLYGTKLTYYMPAEGGQPFVARGPGAAAPGAGAPGGDEITTAPEYWDRLPEPLRLPSGHGGSHVFLTHEFVSALIENREPIIDIHESLAMTVPGIVGHQSALKDGELLKIPSFD